MIEIKELAKLKVKFIDQEFALSKPNRIGLTEINQKLKSASGQELDVICEFLVKSGLPQEVVDQLAMEHIQAIFEGLVGAKKN